jgi:hypothetical protein
MIDLKTLMDAGDELLETRIMPGEPDWRSLHKLIPDDAEPDEEEPDEDDDLDVRNREAADEKPAWLAAMADDLQPLGQALEGAMNAGDESAVNAALKKISERMPDFLSTTGLEAALEKAFTSALSEP